MQVGKSDTVIQSISCCCGRRRTAITDHLCPVAAKQKDNGQKRFRIQGAHLRKGERITVKSDLEPRRHSVERAGRQAPTALDYPRSAVSVGKYLVGVRLQRLLRVENGCSTNGSSYGAMLASSENKRASLSCILVAHPLRATCFRKVISLVPSGSVFSSTAAWATAGK